MKPSLELTIYPKPERCRVYPECPIEFHEVGNWGPDKRLSDAEAAAEYWHYSRNLMQGQATSGKKSRPLLMERLATMRRFATLPNYDEDPDLSAEAVLLERVARDGWSAVIEYGEITQKTPPVGYLHSYLLNRAKELRNQ